MINQYPDPVNPGEYVEVRWKVVNNGTEDAKNVVFEIVPEYPFSLDPGVSATKDLINVWGLQKGKEGVILYYKLRVDKDAVEGDADLRLRYRITDASGSFLVEPEEFTIRIQTIDAALGITSVTTEPKTIVPGEESKIIIELTNLADSIMEDITLKLDLSSDDTPIAPTGGSTEKRVRYLRWR
ncbi:MAG: hypothetical protein IH819_06710 [Bacteroidetes bacterium]|nr:hypothetical protein [Bacteroidota bacterium]